MKEKKYSCPYTSMPDHSYWSRSVARPQLQDIDPFKGKSFSIDRSQKIATLGSCFAQHIARYLSKSGYNYFVTEDCPKFVPDSVRAKFNFGTFSARYGNVYTSLQLLQLFDRAYGAFVPEEEYWIDAGRYFDPFRPQINPSGYSTLAELRRDREQHFSAVRRMFEQTNVLVFTMGLTEVWTSKKDNAAFPVCPGCGAGQFNPEKYVFNNLGYIEVREQMSLFLKRLFKVNPSVRVILTVSPVPLIATATADHVLAATTYSKAVLRAVAGDISREHDKVVYFPSYEIITGAHARGSYFESDLRGVKEEGVKHVMTTFFRHFTVDGIPVVAKQAEEAPSSAGALVAEARAAMAICDEEILEKLR